MSAELLRRAATKLREHASAASRAPWDVYDQNEGTSYSAFWLIANDAYFNPLGDDESWPAIELHTGCEGDARYIALMHPPVALALADWLDALVVTVTNHELDGIGSRAVLPGYKQALATARAILREATP